MKFNELTSEITLGCHSERCGMKGSEKCLSNVKGHINSVIGCGRFDNISSPDVKTSTISIARGICLAERVKKETVKTKTYAHSILSKIKQEKRYAIN